MYLFVDWRK